MPVAPSFTVVVAVRNEAATLPAALEALARQRYPPDRLEVLVVDGGSTDGSAAIASRYPFRVLADGGRGPGAARNLGVAAARGSIVAFTDGDCRPDPGWVAALAERFADPDVVGVGGALRHPDRGTVFSRLEDLTLRATYRGFITSNVAYRASALAVVGGFDEALTCGEDWDLYWRILDAGGRIVYAPEAVVWHDPPESASPARYLRKQFWYARSDVRLFAKRARALAERRGKRGRSAVAPIRAAAANATGYALLAAGALGGLPAAAAAGAVLASSGLAPIVASPEAAAHRGRLLAAGVLKGAVRAVGTAAGLADLARRRPRVTLRRAPAWALAKPAPILNPPSAIPREA
ncbi:MAG TPA: glycosyltransferase [Candidatus Thermoplasmatota archaeon]|nr:glycosyltransferase [Candidatus Thermoplasmatota archaeon]